MKRCIDCGQEKDESEFYAHSQKPWCRHSECKKCTNIRQREWCKTPKGKRARRSHKLKAAYGITLDEFEEKIRSQGGKCACCGDNLKVEGKDGAHMDHNHLTGKLREILCSLCNVGLGSFKDDILRLQKAISYLQKHQVDKT